MATKKVENYRSNLGGTNIFHPLKAALDM